VITDSLEMWNITLFRAGFLMSEGLLAHSDHYGFVETAMREKCLKEWRSHGYMAEWFEIQCPLAHPQEYSDWKRLHAGKHYMGNFDQYVKELNPAIYLNIFKIEAPNA